MAFQRRLIRSAEISRCSVSACAKRSVPDTASSSAYLSTDQSKIAGKGLGRAIFDAAHKAASPTYPSRSLNMAARARECVGRSALINQPRRQLLDLRVIRAIVRTFAVRMSYKLSKSRRANCEERASESVECLIMLCFDKANIALCSVDASHAAAAFLEFPWQQSDFGWCGYRACQTGRNRFRIIPKPELSADRSDAARM